MRRPLGYPRKRKFTPHLEEMVKTVLTFANRWGMKWVLDYLSAGVYYQYKKREAAKNHWNKWNMHRRSR